MAAYTESIDDDTNTAASHDIPLDFHKRFGASFNDDDSDDDLNYGDEDNETNHLSSLSTIERAAHEDTINSLQEMFPAWSHNDLEALLSSCGDKMDEAVEEIMRLGENGTSRVSAGINNMTINDDDDETNSQLDLSTNMTRTQLDDYERHVINQIQNKEKEKVEDMITIALHVPIGAKAGSKIKVKMIDGSIYNVTIPQGFKTGEKFLAEFPTAPMRQAARRRLTGRNHDNHGDDFLSVVEGNQQRQNVDTEEEHDDDNEMQRALAESLKVGNEAEDRRKKLEDEEEEMLKMALMQSEMASEEHDHVF